MKCSAFVAFWHIASADLRTLSDRCDRRRPFALCVRLGDPAIQCQFPMWITQIAPWSTLVIQETCRASI